MNSNSVVCLVITIGLLLTTPFLAGVAGAADDGAKGEYSWQAFEDPTPELAPGHVARYRITYMKSSTTAANRASTVISVTNHSGVNCATSVDWRIGFAGTACTTVLTLGPGQTGEHCSRALPGALAFCNATCAAPGLTSHEGSAIVGSVTTTGCGLLAVSARTYYTTGTADTGLTAITDAKVVRIGGANSGD